MNKPSASSRAGRSKPAEHSELEEGAEPPEPSLLDELDQHEEAVARTALECACASRRWLDLVLSFRPYVSIDSLLVAADRAFDALTRGDWLEAFAAHPRIGNIDSLRERFANTRQLAGTEQAGAAQATDEVLGELARLNAAYENRHGHLFIVFATGKSADEMLAILRQRIDNSSALELLNAAQAQRRITALRLRRAYARN